MGYSGTVVRTIDTHTAGEPTRIIGINESRVGAECKNTVQYRDWFSNEYDHVRRLLIQEPRGHANMFGAVLVPSSNPEADLGVFFLHPDGYLDSCGHAIIGVVTALYNLGWFTASRPVCLETPAGIVSAMPTMSNKKVESVSLRNIYSTVLKRTHEVIDWESGHASVDIDLVYAGNIFALVNIQSLNIDLTTECTDSLRKAALEIRQSVNSTTSLINPSTGDSASTEIVTLYERRDGVIRTAAIFGDGSIDRSPCGTGACALMTVLHHYGDLRVGEELLFESLIDSNFVGRLSAVDSWGNRKIVNSIVIGTAHITGMHTFVHTPGDPINGFIIN